MASPGRAATNAAAAPLAIVRRFPALAALPRAPLGSFPTPVHPAPALAPGGALWLKRDDLGAESLGGNKVRALELLLGGVRPGDRVVTVGASGSTHALATAVHAHRLGARVAVYRWPQVTNVVSRAVAARIDAEADEHPMSRTLAGAYARAFAARLRGARWVPAGGSCALGVIGHASAAIELAEQVARGELPPPRRIMVPLGSGGTVAGLLLGGAIARLDAEIVAVRVVPRVVANRRRVMRLVRAAASLIERMAGAAVPLPDPSRLRIVHDEYGGAYGRATPSALAAAARYHATAVELPDDAGRRAAIDTTYGAKALAAALREAENAAEPTLFWVTFDGRWLRPS